MVLQLEGKYSPADNPSQKAARNDFLTYIASFFEGDCVKKVKVVLEWQSILKQAAWRHAELPHNTLMLTLVSWVEVTLHVNAFLTGNDT